MNDENTKHVPLRYQIEELKKLLLEVEFNGFPMYNQEYSHGTKYYCKWCNTERTFDVDLPNHTESCLATRICLILKDNL